MNKKLSIIFTFFLSIFLLAGCGQRTATEPAEKHTATDDTAAKEETRIFTDSAGRQVEIPTEITKIAPSGPLAQIILYTSAPDLLVGLSTAFSKDATTLVEEKYQSLPEFGQFYGKNASLNLEALSAAAPDVIIDVGEAKESIKEDMDSLQEQIQIPTVFIEAKIEDLPETYKKLGELLGNDAEMQKLSAYCEKVLSQADDVRKEIKDAEQKSVYYATGNAGLNTNAEGSIHAQVIDTIGAKNVVSDVDIASQGGGTTISMEQLIQWQPDYIITDQESLYTMILSDPTWKELNAVKTKQVYKIPTIPYNFMTSPPSVNQILGIQWLGQLMYPEKFSLSLDETIKEYYQLFYHIELSDKQLHTILEQPE